MTRRILAAVLLSSLALAGLACKSTNVVEEYQEGFVHLVSYGSNRLDIFKVNPVDGTLYHTTDPVYHELAWSGAMERVYADSSENGYIFAAADRGTGEVQSLAVDLVTGALTRVGPYVTVGFSGGYPGELVYSDGFVVLTQYFPPAIGGEQDEFAVLKWDSGTQTLSPAPGSPYDITPSGLEERDIITGSVFLHDNHLYFLSKLDDRSSAFRLHHYILDTATGAAVPAGTADVTYTSSSMPAAIHYELHDDKLALAFWMGGVGAEGDARMELFLLDANGMPTFADELVLPNLGGYAGRMFYYSGRYYLPFDNSPPRMYAVEIDAANELAIVPDKDFDPELRNSSGASLNYPNVLGHYADIVFVSSFAGGSTDPAYCYSLRIGSAGYSEEDVVGTGWYGYGAAFGERQGKLLVMTNVQDAYVAVVRADLVTGALTSVGNYSLTGGVPVTPLYTLVP